MSATGKVGSPAIVFRDARLGYGRDAVLGGLDGKVGRGDLLAIAGPNGAGKSTILKAIVGEARLLSGSLELVHRTPADIAYLPQRPEIDQEFPIAVADFVGIGAWRRLGPWRAQSGADRRRVADAIATVGLERVAGRQIGRLSGGQMQRALFARTIVQDCDLILLDEPFAAIDEGTAADLLAIVSGWGREGRTVLAALHDLDQVRGAFPRTLLLGAGRVEAFGPTRDVLDGRAPVAEGPPRRLRGAAGR